MLCLRKDNSKSLLILLSFPSHYKMLAEGSVLQYLESDSVGAEVHTSIPLTLVRLWIASCHKINYSLGSVLGKQSFVDATKN